MPKKPLTVRDMETLGELIAAQDSMRIIFARRGRTEKEADECGFAPIDFGGSNGSHHGATAAKLAERGLAEKRKTGGDWGKPFRKGRVNGTRGSNRYRPTPAGREAFETWWQSRRDGGDAIEIMGKCNA